MIYFDHFPLFQTHPGLNNMRVFLVNNSLKEMLTVGGCLRPKKCLSLECAGKHFQKQPTQV